jgi:hypothetical protein
MQTSNFLLRFKREIINGIIIFLGIGIYFLILDLSGLSDEFYLRLVNIFIVAYGVNRTIKGNHADGVRGYFTHFVAAFATSTIGAVLSIVALCVYIQANGGIEYMKNLADTYFLGGGEINPFQYCLILLLESSAGSLAVCFCLMQYWKDKVEVINETD